MAPVWSKLGVAPDIVQLAYMVIGIWIIRIFGTHGNGWHEARLLREGYRRVAQVSDVDAERAVFEYRKSLSDSDAAKS